MLQEVHLMEGQEEI